MSTPESPEITPAYAPFDTFESYIDTLKSVEVVPDHIGRAQMPRLSGAIQSHLLATLRFLKLIGPNGKTQELLHQLVNVRGTEEWKVALGSVIQSAYAPIIGDLNIKSGVLKKLREKFQQGTKLEGATLDKAIRFYLKALKAAGVEVSPHFFARKVPTKRQGANGRSKPEPPLSGRTEQPPRPEDDPEHEDESKTISYPLHFKSKAKGTLTVPSDLTAQDLKVIERTLAVIRAYAGVEEEEKKTE